MRECTRSYFIQDKQLLDCGRFHGGLINEGKSIYEVVRRSGPGLLFLDDHLDRLFTSVRMEGMNPWLSRKEIKESLQVLIRENDAPPGNVKIVMNQESSGERHFLAYFVAHRYPTGKDYLHGVKVITFPFERMTPNKKIWRPEFRKEVEAALDREKAFEALLLDSRGSIPEASKANLFAVQGNRILTPPDEIILPGITRKHVLAICRDMGISVLLRKIWLGELSEMDALFLTGTSLHVLPVSQVDDRTIPVENHTMRNIVDAFAGILEKRTA